MGLSDTVSASVEPRDVVRRQYLASAGGDLTALRATLAPDVEWTEMAGFPLAGTYRTPEGVTSKVMEVLGRDWDGWAAHDDAYIVDGENVVVLARYTATHRTTGNALNVRVAHHFIVRGGLIVRFEQFVDTAKVAEAAAPAEHPQEEVGAGEASRPHFLPVTRGYFRSSEGVHPNDQVAAVADAILSPPNLPSTWRQREGSHLTLAKRFTAYGYSARSSTDLPVWAAWSESAFGHQPRAFSLVRCVASKSRTSTGSFASMRARGRCRYGQWVSCGRRARRWSAGRHHR